MTGEREKEEWFCSAKPNDACCTDTNLIKWESHSSIVRQDTGDVEEEILVCRIILRRGEMPLCWDESDPLLPKKSGGEFPSRVYWMQKSYWIFRSWYFWIVKESSLLQHITPLSIGIEPREWKAATGYFWLILIPNFFLRAILGCD